MSQVDLEFNPTIPGKEDIIRTSQDELLSLAIQHYNLSVVLVLIAQTVLLVTSILLLYNHLFTDDKVDPIIVGSCSFGILATVMTIITFGIAWVY